MKRLTRKSLGLSAARWFVRDRTDPDLDKAAFFRWLRSDPRALQEHEGIEAVWDGLDALRGDRDFERELSVPVETRPDRTRLYAAAGVAFAAVGGLAFTALWPPRGATYATALGERREIPLADGSTLALNAASKAVARIGDRSRSVRLVEGEAFLQVAKRGGLPFEVEAAGVRISVLGTAFNLRITAKGVRLDVAEGRVRVDGAAPMEFSAGDSAIITRDGAATRLPAGDGQRATAWRRGVLDLSATPLSEAVEALNRYARTSLVIVGDELGDVRVSGVFRLDDAETFARALETLRLVRVDTRDDRILLSPPRPADEP